VGKLEVKEFLEKVYNLPVLRVDTVLFQGKKKTASISGTRNRVLTKLPDFKKVWVKFAPGRLRPASSSPAQAAT
jgi:ribosomal protein L23